jgi:calpain, invertebrate
MPAGFYIQFVNDDTFFFTLYWNFGIFQSNDQYQLILYQYSQLAQEKRLYEDPEFPPSNESLFFSQAPPVHVQWLRPGQIVKEPQLITEGHTRFDVIQGKLGDCWLMAAAANLTLRDELFYRVVPPDQSFTENYAGK